MSRSAGTGQPVSFRCPKARRDRGFPGLGSVHAAGGPRVKLTGERRRSYSRYAGSGGRSDINFCYQFRCLDCDHVGWSRHIDIARRFKREFPHHANEE